MFFHLKLIPLYKFLALVFLLVYISAAGETRCVDREREALLRFKQGLKDYIGSLSSWGGADDQKNCCEWKGISCSSAGHVISINFLGFYIGGNISSDLLELHHLTYLDLTLNFFEGRIPDFLGSITSLEDLRLSANNFNGTIPHQLGNLTNLQTLFLESNKFEEIIPDFLGSITSLEYLCLSYNKFCLSQKIPESFRNLTQLQHFSINVNTLGEPLQDFFGKLSCNALELIDVSFNRFTGPIPDLRACSKLRDLLLHHNPLSGTVPASLGQLSKLEYLDISADSLQGTVSESLLSKFHNLYWLDLSFNSLTLDLSPDWIPPFDLKTIALASCKMGPSFPTWIRTQTNVSTLDISNAGISDKVPNWLWNLSAEVKYFNLSQNQISGSIPDLSSNFIGTIDFSSNNFSGPLPQFPPSIYLARFSQNMFSGTISFICRVFGSQLVLLDLSDNQLEGTLTNCWDNASGLIFLNLNSNGFHGEIPQALGSLWQLEILQVRGNNLSGQIPPTLKECRNLLLIDIGSNNLSGTIPPWLGQELTNLTHFSLSQNSFHGGIPTEICGLTRIQMLDLSGNNISGQIPLCFDKFSSLVDKNNFWPLSESISYYIDFKSSYYAYVSVQWKRNNMEYRKTLSLLKLIDLSDNRLSGNIPKSFSSLKGLISLNLSRNSLTGRIDPEIGEMEMLESLDLSNNKLSGELPVGLAKLHFLGVLDLSNNSFSGQIPLGTQLQGFNASAFSGNNGLCGLPLAVCPNTSVADRGDSTKKKDGGIVNMMKDIYFYIPPLLGFIVGFWGVVGCLVLNRSARHAYFGLVDVVVDWLHDIAKSFLAKFRQS